MANLKSMIEESVGKIKSHPNFSEWCKGQNLSEGDLVIVNNSFEVRDVATTKSKYYLVLKYSHGGIQKEIFITDGVEQNANLKKHSTTENPQQPLQSITDMLEDQINNLGEVVFALIGSIQDIEAVSVVIEKSDLTKQGFVEIVWDPKCAESLKVNNSEIRIQDPYDEPSLWSNFLEYCKTKGIVLDEIKGKQHFADALRALQNKAEAKLILPKTGLRNWQGVTDKIVDEMKSRKQDYETALALCKGKPEINEKAFNEVLRIAYNFSNDVIPFLNLIISVCDLKPIVLWATIGEHYSLSETFGNLGWVRIKGKTLLQNYTETVGNARNKTFHNLFPIQKTLKFALPDKALRNTELIFFSEYKSRNKNSNALNYQDKELVNLFLKFTRARQRHVSLEFWKKNSDVMDKVIDLFEATNRVLKELYRITTTR